MKKLVLLTPLITFLPFSISCKYEKNNNNIESFYDDFNKSKTLSQKEKEAFTNLSKNVELNYIGNNLDEYTNNNLTKNKVKINDFDLSFNKNEINKNKFQIKKLFINYKEDFFSNEGSLFYQIYSLETKKYSQVFETKIKVKPAQPLKEKIQNFLNTYVSKINQKFIDEINEVLKDKDNQLKSKINTLQFFIENTNRFFINEKFLEKASTYIDNINSIPLLPNYEEREQFINYLNRISTNIEKITDLKNSYSFLKKINKEFENLTSNNEVASIFYAINLNEKTINEVNNKYKEINEMSKQNTTIYVAHRDGCSICKNFLENLPNYLNKFKNDKVVKGNIDELLYSLLNYKYLNISNSWSGKLPYYALIKEGKVIGNCGLVETSSSTWLEKLSQQRNYY
ncbi:MAG: hypothetical protein ACTTJO_00385 [Metamycoplasmataceae bacterium]